MIASKAMHIPQTSAIFLNIWKYYVQFKSNKKIRDTLTNITTAAFLGTCIFPDNDFEVETCSC
jgi:hypothetical protein